MSIMCISHLHQDSRKSIIVEDKCGKHVQGCRTLMQACSGYPAQKRQRWMLSRGYSWRLRSRSLAQQILLAAKQRWERLGFHSQSLDWCSSAARLCHVPRVTECAPQSFKMRTIQSVSPRNKMRSKCERKILTMTLP